MKKLFFAILLCAGIAASAFAQGSPPWTIQEIDGSPRVNSPTLIKVSNGTLSCTGKTCTITISGGGGSGTVTSVAFTGGLISVANPTTAAALTVAGTSGGIPYFSSSSTWASSAALAANAIVLGGGAGATPATTSTASGIVTWIGTPSSANLRSALTDENGTGVALFDAATTPTFTTGIQIGGAAASRKILVGNGTNFVPSTETYAVPGTSGNVLTSDGTNWTSAAPAGGGITVGTTTITGGTTTKVLFDNAGVVGEYTVTGTGNAVLSASPTLTGTVAMAAATASGTIVQTSASAAAFESGPNGSTNPVLRLVNSTASQADGVSVTGLAAGSGTTFTALSSGSDSGLNFTGKGLGGFVFTSGVTTGTGTTAGIRGLFNSLTTGNGVDVSSSSVTTGNLVKITSTSTAAASSTLTGLNIAISGANGTTAQTIYGQQISVTNTNATSGTNVGLFASASGATTNNVAARFDGIVGFGGTTSSQAGIQAKNTSWGVGPTLVIGDASSSGGGNGGVQVGSFILSAIGTADNSAVGYMQAASSHGITLASTTFYGFASSASGSGATLRDARDTIIRRGGAAATIGFGAADAAAPVAQTTLVQSVVAGTTDTAGVTWIQRASLGTSQGAPGRLDFQTGALLTASGSTQQTAVSRTILGASKVLANNTTTTVVNVTDASNTVAGGFVDYAVEVFDGTDLQVETGSFTYQVTNKGGTIANNTITFAGASGVGVTSNYPKNTTTSGTLTVTWAISAANPALLSVNANSSLTPSTGYPRVTYTIRNLTQQAIAVQ